MKISLIVGLLLNVTTATAADIAQDYSADAPREGAADAAPAATAAAIAGYPAASGPAAAPKSYKAPSGTRGSTTARNNSVPATDVATLCGDEDGCEVRLGMYNWDNTGRVFSRQTHLYYNTNNFAWMASNGANGRDRDGVTNHVLTAGVCYFTDGRYENWANKGDADEGFALLSWKPAVADCWLTIVD